MKKEKNVIYYRDMLHKDTMTLLVAAVFFGIISFLTEGFEIFLKSILFIVFYIILICNKKENKSFVGILAIIVGGLMVLTSIGDGSLFGIVYFLFGIFYIIHSIMYLLKLKKTSVLEQPIEKKSKIPYLNLVLVIISVISFFVSIMLLGKSMEIIFIVITFISLLFVFISSIFLMVKKYKGVLLYITFVISIICGIFAGSMLSFRIPAIIEEYKYNNSNEYVIDILEDIEDNFARDVSILSSEGLVLQPSTEIGSYVLINKTTYENAIPLWNNKGYRKMTSAYDTEELENITCDGYVELTPNYERYEWCLAEYNQYDYKETFCKDFLYDYQTKAYISCTGKHTYETKGFDENKLQVSKSDDYYDLHNIKKLEYFFKIDVISYSEGKLLPQPTNSFPIIISKKEYESLETTHYVPKSRFKVEELEGVICDGYVELALNETSEIVGESYISCTGKYNYQTEGFDNTKLSN